MGGWWASKGLDGDECLQSVATSMDRPHYLSVQEDRRVVHNKAQIHAGLARWTMESAASSIREIDAQIANLEPMFRRGEISSEARDALRGQLSGMKNQWAVEINDAVNSFPKCRFGEATL